MTVRCMAPVCGLGLFLLAAAVPAQWRGLGPEGGDMVRVLADPAVLGRLYAVGTYGMSRSDDAGRSWSAVGNGLLRYGAVTPWGMTADGQTPGRLYFLDNGGRVLRSDDSALNWTPTGYILPPFLMLLDYFPVRHTLTAVPGTAGNVLLFLPNGDNYKSTDAGASFQPLDLQLPAGRAVQSIAFDPADPQHLLAALVRAHPGGQAGAPLLRSSDGGASWTAAGGVAPSGEGQEIAFHGQQRVTALLDGRLHISSDNGQTWQARAQIQFGGIVVATSTAPLRLTLTNGRDCVSSSNDFVDVQPCGGGWPDAFWPSEETRFTDLAAVRDGAQGYRLVAAATVQGALALAPDNGRWERSSRGLFARPMRGLALQPGDSRRLFTGSWAGGEYADADRLFASSDGGQNWNGRLRGLAASLRSIEIDPTTAAEPAATVIYAAGSTLRVLDVPHNSGVYKSSDGGAAWVALNDGFPPLSGGSGGVQSASARKVKLDPRSCAQPPAQGPCRQGPLQTVYVVSGSRAARVYKSTSGGGAWQPADAGLPAWIQDAQGYESLQPADLEIDPLNGDLYLAAFADRYNDDGSVRIPRILNGVFRSSSDGGASWQHRSAGLPLADGSATTTRDAFALAVHPRRAGVLWVSTVALGGSSRIYRSSDGGASWLPAGETLSNCDVRDLQVDSAAPDVVYAAGLGLDGSDGCLFRSEDAGASWTALHAGLPLSAIYDLRQDPSDRRRLVLATQRGVWEGLLPSDAIFTDTLQ